MDAGVGALLALPPSSTANADDKEGDTEEEILKIDKLLTKNNLMANSEYRAASKVATAYVHISKSMDNNKNEDSKDNNKKNKHPHNGSNTKSNRTPEALFARHFAINSKIKSLRILSTSNLIDNIASCATAKSIVDAHVLTHADLTPGAIYRNVPVIQLLDSGGVLVDLGVGTKGLIPASHLFDKASHGSVDTVGDAAANISGYRQKIRQAKYKVGNLVTVRCLTVNVSNRTCTLTAKKTLVSNDIKGPIVDYSSSIGLGKIAAGFITKVDVNGITITFYNNVHGRVSSRSLANELGVEDPTLNYTVGDVVAARVVDCVRRRNRNVVHRDDVEEEELYYYQLRLSLKTVEEKKQVVAQEETEERGNGTTASDAAVVPLSAGSVLMPKRMKVLQFVNCLQPEYDRAFLPGYAVVSIKSKFFTNAGAGGDAVECKLPFDQLLDSYSEEGLSNPPMELDAIAARVLTVGKRIDAEGLILTVPNGVDALPVVSLRASLIDTAKKQQVTASTDNDLSIICPSPKSNLFMGEYVRGYVTRIDSRFGAFVRFLDGLTGLIPKLKKGLNENLYDTILCKVTALDITSSPTPKILLKKVSESEIAKKKRKSAGKKKGAGGGSNAGGGTGDIKVGNVVGSVKVADINFARAKVYLVDSNGDESSSKVRARIHVTMADDLSTKAKLSKKEKQLKEEHKIGKSHPFYGWKVGDVIPDVRCVALDNRDGVSYVELSNLSSASESSDLPLVVSDPAHLPPGSILSAIVTSVSTTSTHHGLWVQVCPGISGFIPTLELSTDPDVLNDLSSNYKVGTRLTCCVMELSGNKKKAPVIHGEDNAAKENHQALELSVLLASSQTSFKPTKPHRGDTIVGRINAKSKPMGPPSLMLNLRGGFAGRCCITELADVDDWDNMPLGKSAGSVPTPTKEKTGGKGRVVSDSDADHSHNEDEASGDEQEAAR